MTTPNNTPDCSLEATSSRFHEFLDEAHRRVLQAAGHVALAATLLMTTACDAPPSNTTPTETARGFATAFMDARTVILHDGKGKEFCSGSLLDDAQGDEVAVLTAAHCNFRDTRFDPTLKPYGEPWTREPDGTYKMLVTSPVIAQTGATLSTLSKPMPISEIIAPSHAGRNSDAAIAVLKGHTEQQALDAYESNVLPSSEYRQDLKPGQTTLYMAGWPNAGPATRRDELSLTYIGPTSVTYGDVKAPAENTGDSIDQPPCFGGMSGSVAFIVESDPTTASGYSARIVGTLTSATELTPQAPQGNTYGSICEISVAQLSAENSSILVPVLSEGDADNRRLYIPDMLLQAAAYAYTRSREVANWPTPTTASANAA